MIQIINMSSFIPEEKLSINQELELFLQKNNYSLDEVLNAYNKNDLFNENEIKQDNLSENEIKIVKKIKQLIYNNKVNVSHIVNTITKVFKKDYEEGKRKEFLLKNDIAFLVIPEMIKRNIILNKNNIEDTILNFIEKIKKGNLILKYDGKEDKISNLEHDYIFTFGDKLIELIKNEVKNIDISFEKIN